MNTIEELEEVGDMVITLIPNAASLFNDWSEDCIEYTRYVELIKSFGITMHGVEEDYIYWYCWFKTYQFKDNHHIINRMEKAKGKLLEEWSKQ